MGYITHFYVVLGLQFLLMVSQGTARKNVLFLAADDMRPELGAYSGPDAPSPIHPKIHSPNLDGLAKRSLLLKQAYVQQALCNPSRTSLLTGRRPDTTRVYSLIKYFRETGGNYTTIPQYFKQNGYLSVGMGKIFHPGQASGHDDPISWSVPYYHSPDDSYWFEQNSSWLGVTKEQQVKHPLPDVQIADVAVKTIKKLAKMKESGDDQPFFLAVGFHKPHLPFVFPEEFLDYYPEEEIRLPANPYAPVNMPEIAWYNFVELRSYGDVNRTHNSGNVNETLKLDLIRQLRRAYCAAVSYTDYQIGRVLTQLNESGFLEDTIVAFWGDHGWQLGEHGEWGKNTNFELATRAPMMISVPGVTDKGIETRQMTEFVDLFPTLAEAAGLPPLPLCPENSTLVAVCREGVSLVPLFKNPDKPVKDRVFSQYPRGYGKAMGYTMRTDKYRYTEWVKFIWQEPKDFHPDWSEVYGVELYDHQQDPEENWNVADDAKYQTLRQELSKMLHAGYRESVPPPIALES